MKTTRRETLRALFWGAVGGTIASAMAPYLVGGAKSGGLDALEGRHVRVLAPRNKAYRRPGTRYLGEIAEGVK